MHPFRIGIRISEPDEVMRVVHKVEEPKKYPVIKDTNHILLPGTVISGCIEWRPDSSWAGKIVEDLEVGKTYPAVLTYPVFDARKENKFQGEERFSPSGLLMLDCSEFDAKIHLFKGVFKEMMSRHGVELDLKKMSIEFAAYYFVEGS